MTTNFDPSIGKSTQWQKGQRSPNPGGRPKSRLLSEALRSRLGELKPGDPEARTYAELIADNLIATACRQGTGSVTAAGEIADRLEGRATQRVDVNDITADLRNRSDEELAFHLANDRWPDEDELLALGTPQVGAVSST
jgi:hypothetical protein